MKLPGVFLSLVMAVALNATAKPDDYFGIQVVDDQTGRGVPMVELETTSHLKYYTDSAGYVAFNEPELMGREVWFDVAAHGYEFPKDGFDQQGVKLTPRRGGSAEIKIKRLNIAERLYRITGEGIYRDSLLLGKKPPVALPELNAEVTGQDGILTAFHRGKLYWFYGDTIRVSYPLGNYSMTGATSAPPEEIDPARGFVLHYFTGKDGFTRKMAPLPGEGVVWLFGLVNLPFQGRETMMAFYQRRRGMGEILENGFVMYNDATDNFEKLKSVPLNLPIFPTGYPFTVKTPDGAGYVYFTAPYPSLRVKADGASYLDLTSYECYTCLKPHSTEVDRDGTGKAVWSWKRGATMPDKKAARALAAHGENPFYLTDAANGKPVELNNCSCFWNDYRRKYIMIASEVHGATTLGEVWYAEAARPEGPWHAARKIITHANKPNDAHDFYNPTQHPFFDQTGGRVIYLEGSYVNTFSGNHQTTPLYEYNQIMYRLDLADPRLR